ncbi:MAG: cytochrome ubiquinol oxidase subunit I [Bacteroidales bacterium]|nr:cytochrome ubiquinol oxidase subunit I [Bacteroidales bacterium]MCF8328586.1 cytochrome ubiquinol oxidase subunit I [Bacteroidales bacterium]
MIENIMLTDLSLVNWSRGQFALTAMYHYMFVPLTMGLAFLMAIMESFYVKTGNPEWKRMTKFWMTLFGINFAIGVATGLILEFEFGTNWSRYSWFVGDIFGAPLAIEGIMAFFLESTFIAVMFFGWKKVSKKFHLLSTWLVAVGANLSALWILVANAWMQYPTGMNFNPDTARNEMLNFWDVFLSPVAVNKFLHTITSAYVLSALFVIGVSAWFLMKKRHYAFAKKSMVIAATFGLISGFYLIFTGDGSAYQVAQKQPMKLAAMEGMYDGQEGAGLLVFGALNPDKEWDNDEKTIYGKIEIPKLLSILGYRDQDAFVPGVTDLVEGGYEYTDDKGNTQVALSAEEKIKRGRIARTALGDYKEAKKIEDEQAMEENLEIFRANFQYFGYGFLNEPDDIIPNVPLTFYSFHIMVGLGFYFLLFFVLVLFFLYKNTLHKKRWMLWLAIITIPLPYIASQAGWIVAEVGRQPWVIQDLMPTVAAVSRIDATTVQITFWMFAAIFTALIIAEISILTRQIKNGPKTGGE